LLGFAIPHVASPQLGLAAHKLGGLQSVLLMAMGLAWPKLNLNAAALRIAFWHFIYAAFAILVRHLGRGQRDHVARGRNCARKHLPGGHDQARGILIWAGLISFALVLWGLLRSKDMIAESTANRREPSGSSHHGEAAGAAGGW
jgi:hydroxylaminobenzene mutase